MNLDKYPTLHRDIPLERPHEYARTAHQDMAAGVAFYGPDEWITPAKLKAMWQAEDAAKKASNYSPER